MNTRLLSKEILIKPSGKELLFFLTLTLILLNLIFYLRYDNFLLQLTLFPFLVCAVISAVAGYLLIPVLQKLKTGQIIREDGPQAHLKKAGTPTMGGVFFLPVGIIVALLWSGFNANVIAVSLVTLGFFLIGFIDDWQILKLKSNKGISPRVKLLLQIAIAVLFSFWMFFTQPPELTTVNLPLNISLAFGLFFWPLVGFVLVAESNATNLTDGVDGLAAGTAAIAFMGLAAIVSPTAPELTTFCACISGACLGFVVHNRNKAAVFMGDTGSLALGPALAAVALLTGTLWSVFIISGIFFIESISVIAQVTYFKATKGPDGQGKRLFKMAPFHHHLELSGWSETQVVGAFYLVNTALVFLALVIR